MLTAHAFTLASAIWSAATSLPDFFFALQGWPRAGLAEAPIQDLCAAW
jgi:hypothetical protein